MTADPTPVVRAPMVRATAGSNARPRTMPRRPARRSAQQPRRRRRAGASSSASKGRRKMAAPPQPARHSHNSSNNSSSVRPSAAAQLTAQPHRKHNRSSNSNRPRIRAPISRATHAAGMAPPSPSITAARRRRNSIAAISTATTIRISRRMKRSSGIAARGTTNSTMAISAGGMPSTASGTSIPSRSTPTRPSSRTWSISPRKRRRRSMSMRRPNPRRLRHIRPAADLLLLFLPGYADLLPLCQQLRLTLAARAGRATAVTPSTVQVRLTSRKC